MNGLIVHRLKLVADDTGVESLYERANRMKHRWFKRIMYDRAAGSSEKCFAYIVIDRLNCVTLDCWPSQKTIADQLGCSTKTVHRMACALERRGYLRISRNTHGSYRYAPVFLPEDEDKSVSASRQTCPPRPDKNVDQSFLGILTNQSSPRLGQREAGNVQTNAASKYERRQRGSYEAELAKLLGNDGFEILARLSEHDDAIVERLCHACADGELGARELSAARLAAEQLPRRRRPT
jgi:biotin operon repressor